MREHRKRRTQAERTEASDNAMYKAAVALIARDGPSKMTLSELGKTAGFSGALVSYRFGSKSNMLQATAKRILQLWRERMIEPALHAEPGLDNVKRMTQIYLAAVKARSDIMLAQYRLMHESYTGFTELRPIFEASDEQSREEIVAQLKHAQMTGEIDPDLDLAAFALSFVGTQHGIATQYFINPNAMDLDRVYRSLEYQLDVLRIDQKS